MPLLAHAHYTQFTLFSQRLRQPIALDKILITQYNEYIEFFSKQCVLRTS